MATPSYAALQLVFDRLSQHANRDLQTLPPLTNRPFLQELKKEIAEIKLVVGQILLARAASHHHVPAGMQGQTLHHNSGHRKRSAAHFDSNVTPSQLEQPGGSRSVIGNGDSNIDPEVDLGGSPAPPIPINNSAQNATMPPHDGRKSRKQMSDYVVQIRQQYERSGATITTIQIPVPAALECDPSFAAAPEHAIVEQYWVCIELAIVEQVARQYYERDPASFDIAEVAAQLCKRLAEIRVFGARLMAQATVAGPNHSIYSNLPDEGIIYIAHVCRRVLAGVVQSEDQFWDVFREAMRKLSARCRRVRHGRKTKEAKEETDEAAAPAAPAATTPVLNKQQSAALALLADCFSPEQWLKHAKQNASMPEVEPVMRQFTHIVAEIPEEPVNLTAQPDDNSGTFSPQMRSS